MRKFLLLVGIFGLFTPLMAQKGFKFGLRFSPIVSWVNVRSDNDNSRVRDGNDFSARFGISYGATLQYGFLDNVGLVSGLHIVNKGYTREVSTISIDQPGIEPATITGATQRVRMTTVEIPFLLRGRTGEVANNLYIVGNFGVSLDVSAGYRNEWEGIRPDRYFQEDSTLFTGSGEINQAGEYLSPLNLTFVFGAGVDYEIEGVGMINAGLTYHQGLTDMRRQRGFEDFQDLDRDQRVPTMFGMEQVRMNYMALDLSFFF